MNLNSRPEVCRCVICNKTSKAEVATEEEDFFLGGFTEISYGRQSVPAFICSECMDWERELQSDYSYDDEDSNDE